MATGNDREERLIRRNLEKEKEAIRRQLVELRKREDLLTTRERQSAENTEVTTRREHQASGLMNQREDSITTSERQRVENKEETRRDSHASMLMTPRNEQQNDRHASDTHGGGHSFDERAYTTLDELEQSKQECFDISAETKKLDEKLSLLRERNVTRLEQEVGLQRDTPSFKHSKIVDERIRGTYSLRDYDELEDSQQQHEEERIRQSYIEEDKQALRDRNQQRYRYSTPDLNYKDSYMQKLETIKVKEEDVERWSFTLKQKEDEILHREDQLRNKELEINEYLRQRDMTLTQYEEHLQRLQLKMNERIDDMEKRFQEKEKQLSEHRMELDTQEKGLPRSTMYVHRDDERSKQKEEIEQKIRDLERQKAKLDYHPESNLDREETRNWKDNLSIKLNLTPFSGKEPVPRNEASYEEFKIEFESVRQIYSEQVLRQALRKSLKEQARKTMLHLGPNASVKCIMKSLEETFGSIASEDTLLSKFLLAEQNGEESIVEWGLRLEEIMLQVSRKSRMDSQEQNARLKKRFWRGLRSEELKHATRVHFESPITYEELRNKVRAEEFEIQLQRERTGTRTKTSKMNQIGADTKTSPKDDTILNLVKQMENLNKKLEEMKKVQDEQTREHRTDYQPPRNEAQENRNFRFRQRGRGNQRGFRRSQNRQWRNERVETHQEEATKEDKNQKGHLN